MKKRKINTITLPEKVGGQYWLQDDNELGKSFDLISIEGVNGQWILKSNKNARVINSNQESLKSIILEPMNFYALKLANSQENAFLFTEPITNNRQCYKKYMVKEGYNLLIGRSERNDIVFNNKFVSSTHAKLVLYKNQWTITDLNSANGTFVNSYRVTNKILVPGDVIYIFGLKIILGNGFIAINNPDGQVTCKGEALKEFIRQPLLPKAEEEDEYVLPPVEYFYRSPRFKRDIKKPVFRIDSPPNKNDGEDMPLMLTLGPALTMGMASMTTGIFSVSTALANGNINSAIPSIVMSLSMLLGSMLWPTLTRRYQKKRRREKETLRQAKYREYLDKMSIKFDEECARQEEILRENHISIQQCIERIKKVQRNLWERGLGQEDFLKLRVGIGVRPLIADIQYSQRKFSLEEDKLLEELYALCESPRLLKDIPITLSYFEEYISGVIGERRIVKEFAKGLIFQIAALYSYDEVKLVFIYDLDEEKEFSFVKWLPHVWNNDKTIRFVAANSNEVKEISAYIEKEIEARLQLQEKELAEATPYYVIFAMSKRLAIRAEMLKQIYSNKKNLNISVITFYDELKNLPKDCTTVVELEENLGKIIDRNDITGQYIQFAPDIFINTDPVPLSVQLANVHLDTLSDSNKLPSMVTFLQMFGVGKVEHLNALTRWKENDPTKTLEAAVGVDTLGELFKLDLHEKFHGPHGLVAGMTGSGKSEFIITYILSLAVNYHPYEVAFILIDYKGGGMAKAFENLPHTAGIITNLDGSAVKRSLISIESELKRRQAVFAEVSKKVGISNIDIYKYQKLYREGTVSEPLQHLFIISDEFAELKTQQPEFMAQLISAARIGRSLGVHLILATQKPSGVVDDQIWSNSKFRVCLKVQERADSMDMLKRPDAAELSHTGRFYLQVGYNELFELGQSAWAGAPYYPSDKVMVEKDNSVVVIDRIGRPVKRAQLDKKKAFSRDAKKQVDAITDYLSKIAKEEKIEIRPLWLDPIPAKIYLKELKEKYKYTPSESFYLNPVIGEYDDPARQRQCLLQIPISQEGNVVVYGAAGSGKTTFINALIYSIMEDHTPEEVNFYIFDFASETLRAFAKAPHVGDVVLSYEGEKVTNSLKMLYEELERRKKLFADYGGDYRSYIMANENKLPNILIIINNFAAFTETYPDKEDAIAFLSREGTKYGIYFVLTAVGTNAVRFRLLQNFKQLIAMQMNDESEYSTIVGKTDGLLPSKFKGRGLVKLDAIYEFQTAHITKEPVPFKFIQNYCIEYQAKWNGTSARKIPILPEKVDIDFLGDYVNNNKALSLPIGVEKNTLQVHYYPFGSSYINLVLSASNEYLAFLYALSKLMVEKCALDVSIFDLPQSYIHENNNRFEYYTQAKECEEAMVKLFDFLVYRNNTYKEALERGEEAPVFQRKVIVINSLTALKNALSREANDRLDLILEKGEAKYSVTFILAEPVKNLTSISFEKWYKKHITENDGIWIGNGITEQYQLKALKNTKEMYEEITQEFGFAMEKGKPIKIKVLNIKLEEA